MNRPVRSFREFLITRVDSFRFAFAGWRHVLATQPNTWIHATATVLVVALGLWLHLPGRDLALLLVMIALVWTAEFINTALESVVDLASPEQHPLAKAGKDAAAGAVLVAAVFSVAVGLLVLGPPLVDRLRSIFGR